MKQSKDSENNITVSMQTTDKCICNRSPLTEEEIAELARQEQFLLICDGLEELTEITRAIERAHGIG